jgi:hypothetical protein
MIKIISYVLSQNRQIFGDIFGDIFGENILKIITGPLPSVTRWAKAT